VVQIRLRKNQRTEMLRRMDLFSACGNAEPGRIASPVTQHEVLPGKVVTKRREFGQEVFIVIEGRSTASRKGAQLATLGSGSLFGELALPDGGERTDRSSSRC